MSRQRLLYLAPALACAGLLAYGYWLQYVDKQDPCPLCLVQRAFYYLVIVTFVAAAVHGPKSSVGNRIYAGLAFVFAAAGFGVAGRQVWLQHLPADQVPACGPDLYFMLENLPLGRTIEKLFAGSGQCAEVTWRFLGLSIAEWSLAWFLALALYTAWLGFSARSRSR